MARIYDREACMAEYKMTPAMLFGDDHSALWEKLEFVGYFIPSKRSREMFPLYLIPLKNSFDLVIFDDEAQQRHDLPQDD